jgi:hypothetical protein
VFNITVSEQRLPLHGFHPRERYSECQLFQSPEKTLAIPPPVWEALRP